MAPKEWSFSDKNWNCVPRGEEACDYLNQHCMRAMRWWASFQNFLWLLDRAHNGWNTFFSSTHGWGLVLPSKQTPPVPYKHSHAALLQAVSLPFSLLLPLTPAGIRHINTSNKKEAAEDIRLLEDEQKSGIRWEKQWQRKEERREESRTEGGRVWSQISCPLFSHISVCEHWSPASALERIPVMSTCKPHSLSRGFRDACRVWMAETPPSSKRVFLICLDEISGAQQQRQRRRSASWAARACSSGLNIFYSPSQALEIHGIKRQEGFPTVWVSIYLIQLQASVMLKVIYRGL